jgi:hypothetical protein
MNDSGHEAVGQALLITAVSVGALSAGQLSAVMLRSLSKLIAALG